MLESYLRERKLTTPDRLDHPLLYNSQRGKLTRAGVTYVLQKYQAQARRDHPTLPEKIAPHDLRHSKAMHLLQAGVNLIYIRDLLGHENVKTTEIYARADTEMKRKALEQMAPSLIPTGLPSWNEDSGLLAWLRSL